MVPLLASLFAYCPAIPRKSVALHIGSHCPACKAEGDIIQKLIQSHKDSISMSDSQNRSKILTLREGGIGSVIINNEAKRNAMSLDMWQAIPAAIEELDKDPEIHVILIKGAGDIAFVSGADISEFDTVRAGTANAALYDQINADCYRSVRNTKKPTIALIKGFCMGGGFGLAAACDLRLSNESGKFGIPAGKLGVGYPLDAVADIVNLVGSANAKEIYLTAKVYNANEAQALGFLNAIFEDESFDEQASAYYQAIAKLAPLSAQYHKAAINSAIDQVDCLGHAELKKLANVCFDSEDYTEGRRAFKEKRKPIFTGK